MSRNTVMLLTVALLALCLHAAPAQAQLLRTHVSAATGNDANTCDRTVPCRTFAGALAKTLAGGEIFVLDPGGYGIVTINKSVSIIGAGAGGIRVNSGATGITISAGVNDTINLRGLIIDGTGTGFNGIFFSSGASLTIEDSVIRHVTNAGIFFQPAANTSLLISNSVVTNTVGVGIYMVPTGTNSRVTAVLNRVEVYKTDIGISAQGGAAPTSTFNVTVADSVLANNVTYGLYSSTASGNATTRVLAVRSVFASNGTGIGATQTFTQVGQSALTGNQVTWVNSGLLQSFGDNYIVNNADGDPALPSSIAKK